MNRVKTGVAAVLLALILAGGLSAQEQDKELKKLPGYVDFGEILPLQKTKETVEVYLREPLLSLIAAAADTETARILANLKMIRVKTFSLPERVRRDLPAALAGVRKRLERQHWYLLVSVKDTTDWTHVYMKNSGKKIAGLVVVDLNRGRHEITFVNLVGNVDLAALSSLSGRFNIPQLDSIRASKLSSGGKK